jgi:hypothetical protein
MEGAANGSPFSELDFSADHSRRRDRLHFHVFHRDAA